MLKTSTPIIGDSNNKIMKKAFFLIISFVLTVSLIAQQNSCDPSISINIDSQNSTEVVYSVSGSALNMNASFSWVYFNMGGMCIGGSAYNSPSDTISLSNNLPDTTVIWCMISDSLASCTNISILVYDSLFGWHFMVAQTYIPDDNFEQALIDAGYDDTLDNYVVTSNINTLTYLNLYADSVSDLLGIQDFISLIHLNVELNQLTSLDVSQNTSLNYLNCGQNQLTSLDISQNTSLTELSCHKNQLTT